MQKLHYNWMVLIIDIKQITGSGFHRPEALSYAPDPEDSDSDW